ncbi:hypothetical protein ACFQ07_11270 [Actinomadura adrarensis]|uniref:Uncharacterized protein n=1 Tax=Actinomadura adrarensis TaxID=1819600 RepID=A0ABW3CFU2_9ACTN
MTERTSPEGRLAALGAHLGAHGFHVELTARGLKVCNPHVAGCCQEVVQASDTVTCRARPEVGGTLWFYTSWGEPIAAADRIIDAKVAILGNLAERHRAEEHR